MMKMNVFGQPSVLWCCAETITGPDGISVVVDSTAPDGMSSSRNWMNDWTIFYWYESNFIFAL
jgi:choline-glycine betaine transporter